MIRLSDIKIKIGAAADAVQEQEALRRAVLRKLKIGSQDLYGFTIFKKSVDARRKEDILLVYTVDVRVRKEERFLHRGGLKSIMPAPEGAAPKALYGAEPLPHRPVIVGMGPAGLFAGLLLAKNGYRPIILERGEDVDRRAAKINLFWQKRLLDPESNVQFGEGGAGTFSDGKLTTLINDRRCRAILEEFVKAGAPPEILYQSKPHIGTDILKGTVKNIREAIRAYGGEVRFTAKVTDFIVACGQIAAVVVNSEEELPCQTVLLAIGHSARDTFELLHRRGVVMSPKAFSIGVRIEHPQEMIDQAQYGVVAGHPALGAADYKLAYHGKNGRSAYAFCMCPGGFVVAAATDAGGVVTNGMSAYRRDGANANAALLVGVTPHDFSASHPLAGIEWQRTWERLAFQAAGGSYNAPVQLTGDFLADRKSNRWGGVRPTYRPGVEFAELKGCLPAYVADTLKEAIVYFDTQIKGFARPDGILTGVETRSSSPVRINRDENGLSNIAGLYPMGEGAGYAGGIMSSAVDGMKTAANIMLRYAPYS